MSIRPAEAKRTHACRTPAIRGLPLGQCLLHVEWAMDEIDSGVGPLEIQAWGELAVLQSQHNLDQTRNACRGAKVTDVGLNRADRTETVPPAGSAECFRQARNLDGVPQGRGRA